jgi:hypothetical protein
MTVFGAGDLTGVVSPAGLEITVCTGSHYPQGGSEKIDR